MGEGAEPGLAPPLEDPPDGGEDAFVLPPELCDGAGGGERYVRLAS